MPISKQAPHVNVNTSGATAKANPGEYVGTGQGANGRMADPGLPGP